MRSSLAKAQILVAALILTWSCFEVVFRLLDYRGFHKPRELVLGNSLLRPAERLPGIPLQYRPNSEYRIVYDSNPRGYFDAHNSMTFQLNGRGHRGPDFELPKPQGVFRIVVLGDSFTFGEGVKLEHIFTTRLAGMLHQRVSDRIEVINAGTGSWSTDSELRYLRARALDWQPDLVLMIFVPNDADYVAQLDLWTGFRATYQPPRWLSRSYVMSFVYARVAREIAGRRYIDRLVDIAVDVEDRENVRAKWQHTLDAIQTANELAKGRGAEFAIVVFPFMYQLHDGYPLVPIHEKVRAQAAKLDIPYLDLLSAFRGESYADLWVHPSDQHPNERGHAIAAEAIGEFLIENRLVGPLGVER